MKLKMLESDSTSMNAFISVLLVDGDSVSLTMRYQQRLFPHPSCKLSMDRSNI